MGDGRPKGGYFLADGTRVPSVTTILGKYRDPGGLMWWAWDLGMRGLDYKEQRDSAASAGSLAHSMIEAFIKGEDPEGVVRAFLEKIKDA